MTKLADLLTPRTAREYLLRLIADAAINDAEFRQRLIDDPSIALRLLFGRQPPTDKYDFRVSVEDPNTFCFVIPRFGAIREVAAPPTISPRPRFEGRLNSVLRQAPGRVQEFIDHPHSFIANELNFRLPPELNIVPLQEYADSQSGKGVVHVVLKYPPHDGLFLQPYSLSFETETSQVSVPASDSLYANQALSVEAWIRASSFDPGNWQNAVVSRHGQETGWELRVGEAIPRFMVTIGGLHRYAQPVSQDPLLVPGRWYYLAGVYTGSELQLWLDGAYQYGMPLTGGLDNDPGPLAVGNNSNPSWEGRNFRGEVDEVRVWGRALAPEEIRRNRPRKALMAPQQDSEGTLRLYFPCSEGNGTTVHDHSGNRNDGALQDVVWQTEGVEHP
jgi:hypothetical protein